MFQIHAEDQRFLAYVKAHKYLGYGRMIQIIANAWYRDAQRDNPGMEEGAFAGVIPFALLPEQEQQAFLAILTSEEKQGMEY